MQRVAAKWILFVLVILFAGCADDKPQTESTNEPIVAQTLRFGHDLTESSAQHLAAMKFASLVEERSKGRLKVAVYPAQSLGNDHEMIEMARKGELDIILPPTAKLSSLLPAMQIIDLPFLFDNKEEAYRVLDGPAGLALLKQLKSVGLVGLAFWESGYKQLSVDRPLSKPEDMEGLKFRIMRSEVLGSQFEAWGAAPLPIEFTNTRKALADGVVNGQENPVGSIFNMGFHEVQSNIILSNHGYLSQILVFSKTIFESMPEDLRRVILAAAVEVTDFQRAEVARIENGFIEKMKQQGVSVEEASKELRDGLKAKSIKVMEKHRMKIGSDLIELFLQEIEQTRGYKKPGLVVALDADLAGNSYLSGLAIRRGIELAIDEINAQGGLLGKEVSLVTRDNSMVSARGLDNIERFSQISNLIAVFGGISSPVALSEIDLIHDKKILYLDPWAAATGIVDNNKVPNYVFRVSVRDEYAGGFLLSKALEISDKVGVLLANNGWGRSNHKAISDAISRRGLALVETQWFDWGDRHLGEKLNKLYDAGAEVIIFVGNTIEGAKLVKATAAKKKQIPLISHWGVVGTDFYSLTDGEVAKIDFQVLQTFSFINNQDSQVQALVDRYKEKYTVASATDIVAPVGTAHAYDLMHLLAQAVRKAGVSDMSSVRDAMEQLEFYDGLVREYNPPFSKERHDALDVNDFFLARYNGRALVH